MRQKEIGLVEITAGVLQQTEYVEDKEKNFLRVKKLEEEFKRVEEVKETLDKKNDYTDNAFSFRN